MADIINWQDDSSHLLLNPNLPHSEKEVLQDLSLQYHLPSHIWIASSGSSQKSDQSLKLIALSKLSMKTAANAANEHLQANSKDVWIRILPRFHVGGLSIELRAELSESKSYCGLLRLENNIEKWDPHYFVKQTIAVGGTLSAMVPTQLHDLIQAELSPPPTLRAIIIGGSALSRDLYKKARFLGWPVLPSYGLTECCSQVATADLQSLTSQVYPEFKVLNHCQVEADANQFLKIKSKALMTGFAQKSKNKSNWYAQPEADWFLSADQVLLQKKENAIFLQHMGRESDFIKINGEGVQLSRLREKLELILQQLPYPSSTEFTLLDVPHARSGRELVLFYSQKMKPAEALSLQQHFNSQVQSLEKISRCQQVNEIPRTALGKVQFDLLRRLSEII